MITFGIQACMYIPYSCRVFHKLACLELSGSSSVTAAQYSIVSLIGKLFALYVTFMKSLKLALLFVRL